MAPRAPLMAASRSRPLADSLSPLSVFLSSSRPTSFAALISFSSSSASGSASRPTQSQARTFSSTPSTAGAAARQKLRAWLAMNAEKYRNSKRDQGPTYYHQHQDNQTKPFWLNPYFKSEKVLSPRAREHVWTQVMQEGKPLKAVSAEWGIDIRRVAAVVRLKEIEKDWEAKNIPRALPYERAILSLLPQSDFPTTNDNHQPHEAINTLPSHPYTHQQLFVPTSESRVFTRADAAAAFHPGLLPPDDRIPHPELVRMEREVRVEGADPAEAAARFGEAVEASERAFAARKAAAAGRAARGALRVRTARAEFRFQDVNVDLCGRDGRGAKAVGMRYGVSSYDRKKGNVKIPTEVK